MNSIDKYILRRIQILDDKLNDLFSPELNEYMGIYLDYSEKSFVDLIVVILSEQIVKDIPLVGDFLFSNLILYNSVGEYIKNNYQPRIMDYYNSRKTYL